MRKSRWIGPVVVLALVAAACGDDDDDTTASSAATVAGETTASGAGTATTAAGDTATTGAVATGNETVLGAGIPSGDACPNKPVTGVPGVTDTEITIGGIVGKTNPTGQPYGDAVDGLLAYIKGVNDAGGVCGRKIKYAQTIDDQTAVSRNLLAARSLIEEAKVFAVLPVVTSNFGAGQYIADSGVPTFGWNINSEWSLGDNMFGEKGSFVCFAGYNADECWNEDVVYLASTLVSAKRVMTLTYGSAPSSKTCGESQKQSFDRWGAASGIEASFIDDTLPFGFSGEALGPTIDKIRSENIDMVFTCMDSDANLRILQGIQNAGLTTAMYWPNGYDQAFLDEFADQIKNPVVLGSFFRPFEAPQSPGMKTYLATMEGNDLKVSELTLTGWINADLFVTGIRAAAGADGTFDQEKVVTAINGLTYDAGGILPEFPWKDFHKGPEGPINCYAYFTIDAAAKTFKTLAPDPAKPWVCFDHDPKKLEYKTFGEEDTGLATTGVQGTETESTSATAAAPDNPTQATADIVALADAYVAATKIEDRLAVIANADSIAPYVTAAFNPAITVKPVDTKVTFTSKTSADVAYGITLNGTKLEGVTSTAYVVNIGGKWLYHPLAACDGVSQTNPEAGAACIKAAKIP